MRQRQADPEILDRVDLPAAEARRALTDLARVNRLLRSLSPVLRTLMPRMRNAFKGNGRRQLLLDVGTGLGDVPVRLAEHARRKGLPLQVLGVDRKLSHLAAGQRLGFACSRVAATADALPFRSGSVDWCLSTLFLHHFADYDNRRILDEMRRVARQGAIVVDLRRSKVTLWLVRCLLPLIGTGRIARHDGVLSVKRSYALAEVAELVDRRPVLELRPRFPCRFSLVMTGRAGDSSNTDQPPSITAGGREPTT